MTKEQHSKARVKKAPDMMVAKPKREKKIRIPIPTEKVVHLQVATFLKYQYPKIIFHSDFAAAARMSIGQIMKNKELQSERGWPDLFLAIPKRNSGPLNELLFCGLYIEIKRNHSEIYRQDGSLKESWVTIKKGDLVIGKYDHFAEQAAMLERLNALGYHAQFGCGYDHCIQIITDYLNIG